MSDYYPDLTTVDAIRDLRVFESRADDELLQTMIHEASGLFQSKTLRTFMPYYQARTYDALGSHISPTILDVDEDLLEIVTLTNGDGTTVASTEYVLRETNYYPKWRIEVLSNKTTRFNYTEEWQAAITVAGFWGYVENYINAFPNLTTITEDVDASETSITVADADDLEVLDYVRIGSGTEIMQVMEVFPSSDTITVTRGQLGTTASTYTNGAALKRFRQNPEIRMAVTRLAAFLYDHRDTLDNYVQIADSGITLDGRFPREIVMVMEKYRRLQVQTVPITIFRSSRL